MMQESAMAMDMEEDMMMEESMPMQM